MKYPRLSRKDVKGKKPTKAECGEKMTIPDEAVTLKDIIQKSNEGFPLPMQREEIELHPDINQVLQGTKYDIPSDAKFMAMSKVQRATLLNNISGLKQSISEKLDKEIAEKKKLDQELLIKKKADEIVAAQAAEKKDQN